MLNEGIRTAEIDLVHLLGDPDIEDADVVGAMRLPQGFLPESLAADEMRALASYHEAWTACSGIDTQELFLCNTACKRVLYISAPILLPDTIPVDTFKATGVNEDRTAAGNGIEARVPFLDHRLIELVAGIPGDLRPGLVWDKQILRRAMRGLLPDAVVERPKVAFFYGDGVRHTYRSFTRMIGQKGDALLEEALASRNARHYLNPDNLRATLRRLEQNPQAGHVEFLLRVLNLGLLEQMAADLPTPHSLAEKAPVPVAQPIGDWDADQAQVEEAVLRRRFPGGDAVLALADDVLLLHAPDDPGTCYLLVDGAIEYVVDEEESAEWLAVLRALDGRRTLADVFAAAGTDPASVRTVLLECIDMGLITAVGIPGSGTADPEPAVAGIPADPPHVTA